MHWVLLNYLQIPRHLFEHKQVPDKEEVPIGRSIRLLVLGHDQLSGGIERFTTVRNGFLGNVTENGWL
jgi:hypothetical protein